MHLIISKDNEEIRRVLHSLLQEVKIPITAFYPDDFSCYAFSQEVETLPFFSQKKAVIVHNFDKINEEGKEAILRYVEKPNAWTMLYLTAAELTAQSKLVKLVERKGKVLRFKEEKPWEKEKRLAAWLIAEAKKEKKTLSLQAATALVQGVDQTMLAQELDKLICFTYDREQITLNDIQALCTPVHHETLWQLGDAILGLEKVRALNTAKILLEDGMALLPLLAHLRTQLITGLEILAAIQQGDLANRFAYLKGKLLEKKLALVKKYGANRLQHGTLLVFDSEVKAKNSAADPTLLLEILIIKLTDDTLSSP